MNQRLLALFTAINILNYLDRFIVAAILPALCQDLAIDKTWAGILVAAYVPGYIVFSPIFGYLGDRFSRPKLMACGVFLWSAATLFSALAGNLWTLILARALVGIGEASFGSMAPGYLKDQIKDPIKVNMALSLFYAAVPVGSALGYILGGQITQQLSWHAALLIAGFPGIVLAFFLLRLSEVRVENNEDQSVAVAIQEISQIKVLRYTVAGYVFNSFALSGLAAFLMEYGTTLGFKLGEIGTYFGLILLLAGFGGSVGGGRFASRWSEKTGTPVSTMLKFIGITALLAAPLIFFAFVTPNKYYFLLLCLVAELLIFAGTGPVNSVIVLSCPQRFVTLTQGLTILILNLLGSLPGPIFVGWVADNFSLELGMQFLSLFLFISGLIWLAGSRIRA